MRRMDELWHRRDLIAPQRLLELSARSDRRGTVRAAMHVASLGVTSICVYLAPNVTWLFVAMFCQGLLIVSLFAPFHECVHGTAFRTRMPNVVIAAICGAVLLLPATFYRHVHFRHHRYTQNLDEDPELLLPKPRTLTQYALYIAGVPYLLLLTAVLLMNATGIAWRETSAISKEAWPGVVREARIHLAVYAAIAALSVYTGSVAVLTYWLGPLAMAQWTLNVFLLAEHTGCAHSADFLENTRTTLTTAPVRFFMWNMPYHAEHHLFPSVPFHALPTLHTELDGRFRHVERGYLTVHRALFTACRPRRRPEA
jgi:fatty acid desaturase